MEHIPIYELKYGTFVRSRCSAVVAAGNETRAAALLENAVRDEWKQRNDKFDPNVEIYSCTQTRFLTFQEGVVYYDRHWPKM